MSQEKNNTQRKKFKQLMFRDRIRIDILLKEKFKPSEVSDSLNFSKRTINREIKRGMIYGLQNSNGSIIP